jgi:hypothetical protein
MKELKMGYSTIRKNLNSGEYFKLQDGCLVKLVAQNNNDRG